MTPPSTVFSQSVLRTKKKSKLKILFLVLGRIIKNNPKLFFLCSLLAIITAIINFNIGVNFKNAFVVQEKHLTETLTEKIDEEGGEKAKQIDKQRIREIIEEGHQQAIRENHEAKEKIDRVKNKINEAVNLTEKDSLTKEKVKEMIEKKGTIERQV